MKILITSGGTDVPIDSVRHIANMSRGTFGTAMGNYVLSKNEHNLIFINHPYSQSPVKKEFNFNGATLAGADEIYYAFQSFYTENITKKRKYKEFNYRTYDQYSETLERVIKEQSPDIIILAAAVSDYGVEPMEGKIRSKEHLTLNLIPLRKVISKVRDWAPNSTIVGFKLMVGASEDELIESAKESLVKNRLDLVAGNDLIELKGGNHKIRMVGWESVTIYDHNAAQMVVQQAINTFLHNEKKFTPRS